MVTKYVSFKCNHEGRLIMVATKDCGFGSFEETFKGKDGKEIVVSDREFWEQLLENLGIEVI